MKTFVLRLVRLIFGLLLYGTGVSLVMQSTLGFLPWDVLNSGFSKLVGISIGTASVIISIVIVVIIAFLKESFGIGTILNLTIISFLIDVYGAMDFSFFQQNLFMQSLTLFSGFVLIAFASYFYMSSGFGAGPRDSLMVCVRRHTHLPIGLSRLFVEGGAVVVGIVLGGEFGLGTVISVFALSFLTQAIFGLMHFDAASIRHETVADTFFSLLPQKSK